MKWKSLVVWVFALGPLLNLFYYHPRNLFEASSWILSDESAYLFFHIRFPRVLVGLLAGGSLSLAGLLLQNITLNPLASPSVLGLNSIVTLSTILYANYLEVFNLGPWGGVTFSLLSSFLGILLLILMAKAFDARLMSADFLLLGIFTGLFVHGLNYLFLILDEKNTYEIIAWTFGQVEGKNRSEVFMLGGASFIGLSLALFISRSLLCLKLGETQAKSLGVNTKFTYGTSLFIISILTGVSVSICGPISFVGLMVPYIAQELFPEAKIPVLPTFILGGLFLSWVDFFSRMINFPFETPLGLLLGLIGPMVFIRILFVRKIHEY